MSINWAIDVGQVNKRMQQIHKLLRASKVWPPNKSTQIQLNAQVTALQAAGSVHQDVARSQVITNNPGVGDPTNNLPSPKPCSGPWPPQTGRPS